MQDHAAKWQMQKYARIALIGKDAVLKHESGTTQHVPYREPHVTALPV
jgi:hypothetical protein